MHGLHAPFNNGIGVEYLDFLRIRDHVISGGKFCVMVPKSSDLPRAADIFPQPPPNHETEFVKRP